jgi:hypothetical protein
MAPDLLYNKIQGLFYIGRLDDAIELGRRYPGIKSGAYYLGKAYAEKGMLREAIGQLETDRERWYRTLAGFYVRAGRRPDAVKLANEA